MVISDQNETRSGAAGASLRQHWQRRTFVDVTEDEAHAERTARSLSRRVSRLASGLAQAEARAENEMSCIGFAR